MNILRTPSFVNDYKKALKKHPKLDDVLNFIIDAKENKRNLPGKFRDHRLTNNLAPYSELHIDDDLLLVYQESEDELIMIRMCNHKGLKRMKPEHFMDIIIYE